MTDVALGGGIVKRVAGFNNIQEKGETYRKVSPA